MKYLKDLIDKKKKNKKITALTAYDYSSAKIVDQAGIDLILVGDSYGMVKLGYKTTLPVSMEEMLIAGKAVSRAVRNSILVIDMPFLSYQTSERDAIYNSGMFLKETNAQAVKIESLESNIDIIEKLISLEIPVMGHIGLTPQSINKMGGYVMQGQNAESVKKQLYLAERLEQVGVCSIVLEGMTAECAQIITDKISIPTIGIGAGPHCDGQILVLDDMLGINPDLKLMHNKKYIDLHSLMAGAITKYKNDVESIKFPERKNYINIDKEEKNKIK